MHSEVDGFPGRRGRPALEERDFPNNAAGRRLLIAGLRRRKAVVRVTLETDGDLLPQPIGSSSRDGWNRTGSVLNPKAVNRFAQTLRRSKTNTADAQVSNGHHLKKLILLFSCLANSN